MPKPFITPKVAPPNQRRAVRPLTDAERERVAQRKLENLVAKFAKPERPEKAKKVAVVAVYTDATVGGTVDWDKQNRRFDQVRTGGKAKKPDGKRRG